MKEQRFLASFAEAINRDVETVKMEDAFRSYGEWDSLSVLLVLAMADREYAKAIPRPQFTQLLTVRDLYAWVTKEG